MTTDSWTFRREYEGHTITVSAIRIPRMETWGLLCRVDNEPYDHLQSVDPWTDARNMIDEALHDVADDLDLGEGDDGQGEGARA